jgi:hypothetical protein
MILSNKYNIILVRAETYLAYISTLIFLIFLVFLFIGWFKLNEIRVTINSLLYNNDQQ